MKRFFLLAIFLTAFLNSQAFTVRSNESLIDTIKSQPKIKYWKFIGTTTLNFNQVSFSNWALGGGDALSGTAGLNVNLNYRKKNVSFENSGIFIYGMMKNQDQGMIKMDDRIEFNSKLNYQAIKYWNYSLLLNFKSQFAPGFAYPDKTNVVSRFFAPAYLSLSLGMDYKPTPVFSLFMSPASGKFTFVVDQHLADIGAFGTRPAIKDTDGKIIRHGEPIKPELGIAVNATIKYKLMKNIILDSRINLYDNYMDLDVANRWNIDMDFETNINFVINSVFSTTFNSRFLYDDNIMVPLYKRVNGAKVLIGAGPRLQIKEVFGIGMVMKLGRKK